MPENPLRYESLTIWPAAPAGAALRDLHALIFANPELSETVLKERLSWQRDPLVLLAWQDEKLVGYKIGYLRKERHYYSWIGGVHPDYRGKGIARALMQLQHDFCREQAYLTVRTHTKNTWRQMLILNLRYDFDIIGTLTDEQGEPKLILEKKF
jgi:predicted GNAT superfamily acetyltransferase